MKSLATKIIFWIVFIVINIIPFLKFIKIIVDLVGRSTFPEDLMSLWDKLDQMPWWIVFFLICAAWITYFNLPSFYKFIDQRGWKNTQSSSYSPQEIIEILDDLRDDAIGERNRLIPALDNFDYDAERQKVRDWKEKAKIPLEGYPHLRSRIRNLNLYDARATLLPGKSGGQAQIESFWTEYLKRIEDIIQTLGES